MDDINDQYLNSFPPGYRFCPDNHELISYLLTKVAGGHIVPGLFHDVDIYHHTPQQLYETYGREGQEAIYFFSPRNKKYPKGRRPDRTVRIEPNKSIPDGKVGFWKAAGKDHSVRFRDIEIGTKRNLVYNEGKPNGNEKKTNWLMHEFMLSDASGNNAAAADESTMHLDDWVLYKIYYNEKGTDKTRVARHGNTEQQGVQNSNEPQPQPLPLPQPMNQNGQLAAYPSLNNIRAQNPLMALVAATGYSNHIGLTHDQYDGLMSTPNLLNNNVAAQCYWETQKDFIQPAIMPAMQQQDDGFMMNMPPMQRSTVLPLHNGLMSSSSSLSMQEEAEIHYYSIYPFSVPSFMQLQNECMLPPSDTTDSSSADTGKGVSYSTTTDTKF